jgi:predicted HicB family RNase H-like nuclease
MTERIYGHTAKGTPITDEMVERAAEEAERGFDVDELIARRRGPGRPSLGEAAKGVESVRLEQELRERVAQRAEADGVTFSEIVRRALREYLRSA